ERRQADDEAQRPLEHTEHRRVAVRLREADAAVARLELDDGAQRPGLVDARGIEQRPVAERDRRDADRSDADVSAHAGSVQLAVAPDFFTSAPQRGISLAISAASSSGVPPTSCMPSWSESLACTSGIFSALAISACSRWMIGLGVPLGANTACHDDISKPGTPASAIVGVFGASGIRLAVV